MGSVRVVRNSQRGSWSLRIVAHKGQRLSAKDFGVKLHGYPTKAEAREAAGALQVRLAALASRATSGATVADYLAAWLDGREVSAKTRADYSKYLRLYINPAIGATPLRELTPEAIGSLLTQLSDRPATARVAYGLLRKAFSDAHKRGHVASNPAALVDSPRYRTPEVEQRWNQDQLRTSLDACRSSRYPYNALFPFLLATGLRRGEALALRWADVDLEAGTVRVHRARGFAGPGQVVEGSTKTGKQRMLALDGFTVKMLKDHHKRQARRRASEYVFADGRGRPLFPDNPSAVFRALVKRTGLPPAHLHPAPVGYLRSEGRSAGPGGLGPARALIRGHDA